MTEKQTPLSRRISQNVTAIRKEKKLTVEALSKETENTGYHIPASTLSNLENERKKRITVDELYALATALGVESNTLMGTPPAEHQVLQLAEFNSRFNSAEKQLKEAIRQFLPLAQDRIELYSSITHPEELQETNPLRYGSYLFSKKQIEKYETVRAEVEHNLKAAYKLISTYLKEEKNTTETPTTDQE